MAKEIGGYVKLQVKGGQANPSPPIGPALGSKGLNIMEFCKQFNGRTQDKHGCGVAGSYYYTIRISLLTLSLRLPRPRFCFWMHQK